jgi:AcrR family transcriptional regulator
MTLYHYVANKDELITLMVDEVMGELLVPEDELSDDWRAAMTQIATRTRDAFTTHRWTLDRLGDGRPGPNGLRHFEQSLRAVAGLGLDQELVFELIGQLDDYVFGYALREAQEMEEHERGWPPEVLEFFQREIDSGDYPLIREFLGDDADAGVERVIELLGKDGRFERGLNRLLDGIEAEIKA